MRDGIVVVDKPKGMTSHDVVDYIRRRFKIEKVGHAGTLDPMAEGVLILLLGRATKLSNKFMSEDKEYEATLRLGSTTDTQDAWGKVLTKTEAVHIDRAELDKAFNSFLGEREQTPPMVSAIRYQGKRLYKLARKGKVVPRKSRKITIKHLEIISYDPPDVTFRVACSKGTYIRTLCEEIGNTLGVGGHQAALRRILSGGFSLKEAIAFDDIKNYSESEFESKILSLADLAYRAKLEVAK